MRGACVPFPILQIFRAILFLGLDVCVCVRVRWFNSERMRVSECTAKCMYELNMMQVYKAFSQKKTYIGCLMRPFFRLSN